MKILKSLCTILALVFFTSITKADVVTDWNKIAIDTTNVPPGRPGPSNLLDMAAVHLAIYDAVQAIEGDYRPYCTEINGASGSSVAAAARAAHDVLANRFPAQADSLEATLQEYLAIHGISPLDAGIPVGATAASCINTLRANDDSFPSGYPAFFGSSEIGQWRPTTPGTSMAAPWLGFVKPYTISSASQFRPGPPPVVGSPEYTRDYNEVKDIGRIDSTSRAVEQTTIGNFWNLNYQAVIQTMLRDLSSEHIDDISDSSRFFALTTAATADAVITAWDSKRAYNFWRPVTAIRSGADDGNDRTEGDPAWSALIPTPPYADYTSGANAVMAASTRAAQLFFGENEMTVVVRKTPSGPNRTFDKFSAIRDEVVDARVYGGIHFRFADSAGRKQGEQIAQWSYSHFFRPVE